ncbi:MAG TPA: hypothetical protein VJ742_13345 [Nitrososphaera sp.]|nr:hypothetical protein [Nitrososphaera sp.]
MAKQRKDRQDAQALAKVVDEGFAKALYSELGKKFHWGGVFLDKQIIFRRVNTWYKKLTPEEKLQVEDLPALQAQVWRTISDSEKFQEVVGQAHRQVVEYVLTTTGEELDQVHQPIAAVPVYDEPEEDTEDKPVFKMPEGLRKEINEIRSASWAAKIKDVPPAQG